MVDLKFIVKQKQKRKKEKSFNCNKFQLTPSEVVAFPVGIGC